MAAPQPPPFLGFRPDIMSGGGAQPPPYGQPPTGQSYPYPPGMQLPPVPPQGMQYPGQAPPPGLHYPAQAPPPGVQYPGQAPLPGVHYPGQQPKPPAYPTSPPHYGNVTGGAPANYGEYGSPPTGDASHVKDESFPGWTGFSDKAIRAVFIRKVYLIIMVQLLFTLAVISLFVFEKNVKLYVQRNTMWYYLSYFTFLGVYIALACCGNLRRKYPTNIIMLSIFTVCMSYMMGTISSFYDTNVVLMAVGICAGVCLAVSVFSFHTKFDFTSCGGVLCILVWVLFLFGIITIFTHNHIMNTVYACGGALLFTVFLAYDTQMLMGGKKHELSPEEHIFAAMQIYLDIVYIFMFLLSILGSGKSS